MTKHRRDIAEPFTNRDVIVILRRAAGLDPTPVTVDYEPHDEEPPGRKPNWNFNGPKKTTEDIA